MDCQEQHVVSAELFSKLVIGGENRIIGAQKAFVGCVELEISNVRCQHYSTHD